MQAEHLSLQKKSTNAEILNMISKELSNKDLSVEILNKEILFYSDISELDTFLAFNIKMFNYKNTKFEDKIEILKDCLRLNKNIHLINNGISAQLFYFTSNEPKLFKELPKDLKKSIVHLFEFISIKEFTSSIDQIDTLISKIPKKILGDDDLFTLLINELYDFVLKQNNHNVIQVKIPPLYGPYIENEIINQLIISRLHGNEIIIEEENYNFLYIKDFPHIVSDLIGHSLIKNSSVLYENKKLLNSKELVKLLNKKLITSYGQILLKKQSEKKSCFKNIENSFNYIFYLVEENITPFSKGLTETITHIQSTIKYDMLLQEKMEEFIEPSNNLVKIIEGGGSSSHLMLLENKIDKKKFVRKISLRDGVEGNGIPKLVKEIDFLTYVTAPSHPLSNVYPSVINRSDNDKVVYYDLEYLNNGENIINTLKSGMKITSFFSLLNKLIEETFIPSYMDNKKKLSEEESDEMLENMIFNRTEARTKHFYNNINKHLADSFKAEYIFINDRYYKNPLQIIENVKRDKRYKNLLKPFYESTCIHGDLTFLNMILSNDKNHIKLIDPRGYLGNIDLLYDFGKMKFSLSGFSEILTGNYDLTIKENQKYYFKLKNEIEYETISDTNKAFIDFLDTNDNFQHIKKLEPNWKMRICFYDAINYLADIPFRLHTDQKFDNSIMCFLYGTIYLNRVFEDLKSIVKK